MAVSFITFFHILFVLFFIIVYMVVCFACFCLILNYIFLLLCMFRSEYSVSLCCSVYCLCVNVYCIVLYCTVLYCATATGCQPNYSEQILSYHALSQGLFRCAKNHGQPTDTRLHSLSTGQQRRKESNMVRLNSRGHQ